MSIVYPQKVTTTINPTTLSHYLDKGYAIPMRYSNRYKKMVYDYGKEIEVDVNDLLPNSNVHILCNCDGCGCDISTAMNNYTLRFTNPPKPQYCSKCSAEVYSSGKNHWNYNPNLTEEERQKGRNIDGYKDFIKRVLERDKYTCQHCCRKIGKDGVVHHLDGYSWCKEKRIDDTNGITLCGDCHNLFHSLYGMKNNTKKQYEEWIGQKVVLEKYNGDIYRLPKIYCFENEKIYNDYYEVAEELHCHWGSVARTCMGGQKTLGGKHYVYYEKYLSMSQQEIDELLSHTNLSYREDRRVICLPLGTLYNNIKEATDKLNIDKSSIYRVLNGKYKQCGYYNNIPLQWKWYTDFTSLPLSEQLQIAKQNELTLEEGSFLYQLLKDNT